MTDPSPHTALSVGLSILAAFAGLRAMADEAIWQPLRPYIDNPFYWQYEGEPTAFFGASDSDNIFQYEEAELIDELDRLVAAGGNQLRNTMSSRDPGDLQPFQQLSSGLYDLNQWDETYWARLEALMRHAQARQIMIQIELWDRFDFHAEPWLESAYNPANNVNYTVAQSGLAADYPTPGWSEDNPFLKTVPGMEDNAVVLPYQEAFVRKVVATAAPYGNILFCVSNETRLPEEWSHHWADLIAETAEDHGRAFPITEMLDSHDVTSQLHRRTIGDSTGRFTFVDISQNSWKRGDTNWSNAQTVRNELLDDPRPINSTKIYGSADGVGGDQIDAEDACANFWRNLLGGFASSRFHRPPSHGIGLNDQSATQLRVARAWSGQYDIFRAVPDADHSRLSNRAEAEAYLSHIPGEQWTLFFVDGGSVLLETGVSGAKRIRWANLTDGEWTPSATLPTTGDGPVTVTTPGPGPWLALVEVARERSFDFETWREANFTGAQMGDASISGPQATPLNDGISNRLKHLLGHGPFDQVSVFEAAHSTANEFSGFEFQRNIELPEFPFTVETATQLGDWDPDPGHYVLEVVGLRHGTATLPDREVIRIRPQGEEFPPAWFARLLVE